MKNAFTNAVNDNTDVMRRGGTRGRWRRDNLEAFRQSIGSERLMHDGFALFRLFDEMEKSPTAKAALVWARKNRIEFIVDHVIEGAGGYYHPGMGVVAIAHRRLADGADVGRAVAAMTHEIRHAWQDYHGLLFSDDNGAGGYLADDIMIEGLFEADAEAHGRLAASEYSLHQTQQRLAMMRRLQDQQWEDGRAQLILAFENVSAREQDVCNRPASALWENMQDWYAPYGLNNAYAQARRHSAAALIGAASQDCEIQYEFAPLKNRPLSGPDFINRRDRLEKLGDSFAGVNYITTAADRDRILRQHLAPSFAERCFDPDRLASPADALTQKIRSHQIRTRLQKAPLPLRPLPK